ncbi:hypothetical protein FRC08_013268 [Ceratobasidium sp. 394]|nr:hypothetical protein FRC08_013268 [Ceratobasidium sp. 394]
MDDPASADGPEPATTTHQLAAPSSSAAGVARPSAVELGRTDRSPTPPRALYRSTTGKGIAFTETDAPHHSRASWMKYWRRHKHELEAETNPSSASAQPHPQEAQQPLPEGPPQKRKRYDHEDDMLLARYFATGPQGTSDAIFQRFARIHPHHPWKGWQEHHRIHKTQIDHLMKGVIQNGPVQAGSSSASGAGGSGGAGSSAAGSSAGGMSIGIGVPGIGVVGVVGVGDALQDFGLEAMET